MHSGRRWLRRAGFAALALLSPWLLYVALGNVFLNVGGINWILGSTREITIRYGHAFTLWPGRVKLSDFHFTFQDQNVQFSIDLVRADLHLKLSELPSRTFHATRLRGDGASFRMRHRIQPNAQHEPWVRALAPIPEFSDPPLFESTVPTPPVPESEYKLWTVHMEDVDVGVSELWVQFIRYRGTARASGAFRLRPARHLWVGPAALDLEKGRVTLGEDELLHDLAGRISCTAHPFDVRVPVGLAVLRHISSRIQLRGERVQLAALPHWFSADEDVEFAMAPAALRVDASVQHGRAQPGSLLRLESDAVSLGARRGTISASAVRVQSQVESGGQAQSELVLGEAELVLRAARTLPPARLRDVTLAARIERADAADPPNSADRSVNVREFHTDARWLNGLGRLPGFEFLGGTIDGKLALREHAGRANGQVHAAARNLSARTGPARLLTSGHIDVTLHDASPGFASGRAELAANFAKVNAEGPFQAKLTDFEIKAKVVRRAEKLEAQFHAQAREARAEKKQLWLRLRPAVDADLRVERIGRYLRAELRAHDVFAGSSGSASDCPWLKSPLLRATLNATDEVATLTTRIDALRFGWGDFRIGADSELQAELTPSDTNDAGKLAFTFRNQGVHVRSGDDSKAGWEASLPNATWRGELSLSPKHPGRAELVRTRLRGRIGETELSSELAAHFDLGEFDLEHKHARFSGDLQVGPAALEAGTHSVKDWWARVKLGSGLVSATNNLDLSALFQAELRDAGPGLAVLAERGSLPKLIAAQVPLEKIIVVGIVQRRCRLTDFLLTRASGGPVSARGRIHSTEDSTRAALLLRVNGLEAISAGLSLAPDGVDVTPLAGDDWLREHREQLDEKARAVLQSPCPEPPSVCSED